MKNLAGLNVLVLGLGESGLAMARWCARHGAAVTVWDSREQPPQFDALRAHVPHARFNHAPLTDAAIAGVQLVLKSPGLGPNDPRIVSLLGAARATGVAVQGELDLFARALADLKAERGYAPQVLAVTGTNGKTTTTALTALLVERAGKRVATAGNIGPTMLDTLAEKLDLEPEAGDQLSLITANEEPSPPPSPWEGEGETAPSPSQGEGWGEGDDAALKVQPPPTIAVFQHLPEVWVLELSSFQLDGATGFEPSAAVVLNVTQDHLDWHGSMPAYAAAKARIYGEHAVMVVNRDDPLVETMVPPPTMVMSAPRRPQAAAAPHGGAKTLGRPGGLAGARGKPPKAVSRKVVRFGLDAPRHPGDYGLVVEGGMAWLVRALESDETVKRRRDEEEEIHLQRLMPADALRIRGRHNAANALAALALATSVGCPLAPMLHGLREYAGEPHRVEFVAQVQDIEAFDDSKGTNVGATVAALLGLGADKEPAKLVVILGGDGKGQDFSPLAAPVARHARAVALIGRDAGAIEAALAATGVTMQRHDTLEAATRWCFHQARPGDAVLLSPACASLDMFRNYEHRAEVFVAEVQSIAAETGEALF